jgi:DNA-binding NtrC family response regulator
MHPAIILVDDEPVVLAIVRRVLRDKAPNYDVITAPNGATALTLIAQRPVVLVITDYWMPDMDGVMLTEAIKVVMPQCPVILMTGYPSLRLHQRGLAAGVEYFLTKPFQLEEFAAMVRAALAQERAAVTVLAQRQSRQRRCEQTDAPADDQAS